MATPAVRRVWEGRIRVRLTRDGGWFMLVLVGVGLASFNTGNNLLYLALSAMLALLVVQNVLGEANLRGIRVERRLPAELFAGEGAEGALAVVAERPALPSVGLRVEELDGSGAQALLPPIPAGGRGEAPATWTLPTRGWRALGSVQVSSTWPFGLFVRSRVLPLPGEVLVYPPRRLGAAAWAGQGGGLEQEDPRRRGGDGELVGLRLYQPGDPVRRVHWRTSARVGQPVVVERAAPQALRCVVRVRPEAPDLEEELARACGQVVAQLGRGLAVGLELGEQVLPAGQGAAHRRRLLGALALFGRGAA